MKNMRLLVGAILLSAIACNPQKGAQLPPPPIPVGLNNESCPAPIPSVNTQISQSPGDANNPVVIPHGRGFYVAWWDWFGQFPTINGVEINTDGIPNGEPTYFPGKNKCTEPSLASDSAETQLAWIDGTTSQTVRIGVNDQSPTTFGSAVKNAVAAPYGGLIWEEQGTLYFRNDGRLGLPKRDGTRPEPTPVIIGSGALNLPPLLGQVNSMLLFGAHPPKAAETLYFNGY